MSTANLLGTRLAVGERKLFVKSGVYCRGELKQFAQKFSKKRKCATTVREYKLSRVVRVTAS